MNKVRKLLAVALLFSSIAPIIAVTEDESSSGGCSATVANAALNVLVFPFQCFNVKDKNESSPFIEVHPKIGFTLAVTTKLAAIAGIAALVKFGVDKYCNKDEAKKTISLVEEEDENVLLPDEATE